MLKEMHETRSEREIDDVVDNILKEEQAAADRPIDQEKWTTKQRLSATPEEMDGRK